MMKFVAPEIGKLYLVEIDDCCVSARFMAKLVKVTNENTPDAAYEPSKYKQSGWLFHFDNNVEAKNAIDWKPVEKWYYWDTNAQTIVFEGDKPRVNPFSILCTDCGGMLKPLTFMEADTLGLPREIADAETCLECNDDPTETISAQFNAEGLET